MSRPWRDVRVRLLWNGADRGTAAGVTPAGCRRRFLAGGRRSYVWLLCSLACTLSTYQNEVMHFYTRSYYDNEHDITTSYARGRTGRICGATTYSIGLFSGPHGTMQSLCGKPVVRIPRPGPPMHCSVHATMLIGQ